MEAQFTSGKQESEDKILIVKRLNLTFSDEICQLITFSDITAYRNLQKEQSKTKTLKLLNRSVSHEMLGPLMANICLCQILLKTVLNENQARIVNSILSASQLVICFTNDLVDNNIIENGSFMPMMVFGSPCEAVMEIIQIIKNDLDNKSLTCEVNDTAV